MFSNGLKLAAKLRLGFGSVLVLLCLVVGIGVGAISSITVKTADVQRRTSQVEMLYGIMKNYDTAARSVRNIALTSDPEVKKKQKDNYDKSKVELSQFLVKSRALLTTDKGKEMLAGMDRDMATVVEFMDKAVPLGMEQKNAEVAEIIIRGILGPQAKMLEGLDVFAKFCMELAETDVAGVSRDAAGGRWLLILVGGGTLVLGALISFFLTRSIVKPVRRVIGGLAAGTEQVATASGQVESASNQLAEGASQQAASLEETSSSLEEMSSMTNQNSRNASQADELMARAGQIVVRSNETMAHLTSSMHEISRASEETRKIIKTIDEIAFQTNLLALNAAVEAARAGEAGAGFAVVADEVRNLALRAAEAAKITTDLVEGAGNKVKEGVLLVGRTHEEFGEVAEVVGKAGQLVGEISAASREQSQGMEQISRAVAEMDKVVQQNAASAEESAAASEELNGQAVEIQSFVGELVDLVGLGNGAGLAGPGRGFTAQARVGHGDRRGSAERLGAAVVRKQPAKALGKAPAPVKAGVKKVSPHERIPMEPEDFDEF